MTDKDKLHYVKSRIWEVLRKVDEIYPHLVVPLIEEVAEDIVHYIKG